MNEETGGRVLRIDTADGPFPTGANHGRLSLFDWETVEEGPANDEASAANS